ncbi:TPA: ABC transporter substrate-binding protein [Burkholderia cenocepacia]|uniref:ABC polar amino acid family transporter periplasmic ligand binding protein n=1 Tax=Burkholderia latens TaxID=488446 RepID=A0A6H9TLA5_9BURK|nr:MULTISPECIES: ABC transporter substrate-binding protein [Burkholderia]KAB0644529.1 amino acid ABC transporter substrate-binding protein [Burkholderia latens]MBJ9923938.1 amino acid ABC transporter substrate-binding protein [Burkholderia cenocepacia]UJH78756.1 ABC transporter substrate-binding protein [Burkholderia cenocepacia]VWB24314.1 ABC polar amino acid family transporter periplasmic ligand binding protein [Burkholderia latens]HDR9879681.1 amino acid ABC transporter substrate-binding pr
MFQYTPQSASGKHVRFFQRILVAAAVAVATVCGASQAWAAQINVSAGTTPSSVPNAFLNIKTNQIEGVMPDVIRAIGQREGFDVSFNVIPFSALIQSVVSDKIDLIVAGMTPTPKREEVIAFSQPVAFFGKGIIVSASDKNTYRTIDDLKGTVIGAGAGEETSDELVKLGIFKEVKLYNTAADMARDVTLGRITAGFNDYPIWKAQEAAGTLQGCRVVDGFKPLRKVPIAFGVKKGNAALLSKINDGLAKIKADGTLDKILKKWNYVD